MTVNINSAIEHISKLVSFDTSPANPTIGLVEYIKSYFDEHGITYVTKPIGNDGKHAVILGCMGPDVAGGVLFSGHMDVVNVTDQSWNYPPYQVTMVNDKLYGRGTCDMKGFIGSILALIPEWKKRKLNYPIYFGFTCDEETTVESINQLIELMGEGHRPEIAIVGEPTDMRVVSGHKGGYELAVEIVGRACHSSRPELGVDAIKIANSVISYIYERAEAVKKLYNDVSFDPPYPIVCVPMLSGGSAANKIAEKTRILFHMRPTDNEQVAHEKKMLEVFLKDICSKNGATYNLDETLVMPALAKTGSSKAHKFIKALGSDADDLTAPFCTEAGYLQLAGVETLVCGPGNIAQAHIADEFVELSQIEKCLQLFANLPENMPK